MIRIINNKKLDLTDDEFTLYQNICRSYDQPSLKGEALFHGLFESDDQGVIQFLIPPSERQTSLEIFLFLVSIFQQQHARLIYGKLEDLMAEVKQVLANSKA